MCPILFDFGTIPGTDIPLQIGSYGLMFALAIIAGWAWALRLGRQIHPAVPWTDFSFYVVIAGFVGAKVTNVVVFLPEILAGRQSLWGTLTGGGVWLGGVIAGSAVFLTLARKYRVRVGLVINAVFVAAPFSHAIGRIGCFLGGCCYGTSCELPWAVTYTSPDARRLNGTPLNVGLHPTVLYEAALEMVNFGICYVLWRRRAPDWSIMAVWVGLYGAERFVLEFFRADPRGAAGPLSTSQWISVAMVVTAAVVLTSLRRRGTGSSSPRAA